MTVRATILRSDGVNLNAQRNTNSMPDMNSIRSLLFKSFLPTMNFILSRLPYKVRRPLVGSRQLLMDLLVYGGREGFLEHARALGIRDKWIDDEPDPRGDGVELARALGTVWLGMKERQHTVAPAYLPAPAWASILDAEWSRPRGWLEKGELALFESFLRNFFREGGISGLWGAFRMFDDFVSIGRWDDLQRLRMFVKQFEAWHREVPVYTLDDLDQPRVGNPWGYDVDGRLVVEPAFEYHALALRIRELVANVAHPIVLEIGGGFGGLARQLLRLVPGIRYVGLDLPENVIIQSWYLSRSLPDRRIRVDELERANQDLTETDALLLPNWALPDLHLSQLDVVVNVHSFGEMSRRTLEAYFGEIVRLQPEWIFHDNLGSPRGDDYYGIPSTEYPPLHGYRLVMSSESRWPRYDHHSQYPCRENLLRLHRSVCHADTESDEKRRLAKPASRSQIYSKRGT